MKNIEIETKRLLLRPLSTKDAPIVKKLAGDRVVAATTSNIPHPYKKGMAGKFIKESLKKLREGRGFEFAIILKDTNQFIGIVGLSVNKTNNLAEIGYWIGKQFWNNGYCSEAALTVVEFGFRKLKLNKIIGRFMPHNIASGKIIKDKLGMEHEGYLHQHIKRFGKYYDLEAYAVLRKDWYEKRKNSDRVS